MQDDERCCGTGTCLIDANGRYWFLDPDGRLDTYLLEPGDVYFVPASYPHHIEVIGDDDIHFLVFFDQATPADIGYRAAASAYSPEVLAATFSVPLANWPALPFTTEDPLIVAKQETGEVPAFKGLAYVVFERLPLANYGNRLPQLTFEVVRAAPGLPEGLRAINIIPGSTEFGYAPAEVREEFGLGSSRPVNRAQWTHATDWEASIDGLMALAPNLELATLVSAWFGDDLRAGNCTFRPKVEKAGKTTSGLQWSAAGFCRLRESVGR